MLDNLRRCMALNAGSSKPGGGLAPLHIHAVALPGDEEASSVESDGVPELQVAVAAAGEWRAGAFQAVFKRSTARCVQKQVEATGNGCKLQLRCFVRFG